MKAFLEVTQWPDTEFNCNHVYWMDDARNKMYAYAKFGNPLDTMTFKTPIQIDTRGRKFEVVRNIYNWVDPKAVVTANPTWTIQGSKGDKYIVKKDGNSYTCTCPGYTYRGECKHVKEIANGS
jgi:hypothetical protein